MKRIYFDNAATTKISKAVRREIEPFLGKYYGNPSSIHKEGKMARYAIEKARERVAKALNCFSDEIFFTSGASESNACVLKSIGVNITDGNNHDSIEVCAKNANTNYSDIEKFVFTGINSVTGELGGITDDDIKKYNWIHADLTQWIGKAPIDLNGYYSFISTASFSGHKFGALKGVGVLFVRRDYQDKVTPLICGHQEEGLRGGTENVVGVVSLGKAIDEATKNSYKNTMKMLSVARYLEMQLKKEPRLKKVRTESIFPSGIINITFKSLEASSAVAIFDNLGVAVSAGSACNSGSDEPSRELLAIGYSKEDALRTIRISLNHQNTIREAKKFCKILGKVIDTYE